MILSFVSAVMNRGCGLWLRLERGDRTEEGSPWEGGKVANTFSLSISTPFHWNILRESVCVCVCVCVCV